MSTNPFDVFSNDGFDDSATADVAPKISVAQAKAGEEYVSICPKCRGTGSFISYSGRNLGPCFSCKGKGKNSYKSSPEARANATAKRVEKKARDLADWSSEHKDILEWFERVIDRRPNNPFRFAVSLREGFAKYGSLTDGQVAAARKCIAQDAERSAARVAAAPEINATKIEQAFAVARERAKRPGQQGTFTKPLKLVANDVTVHFEAGQPDSKWDGFLFVKRPDDSKLGYVKDGKFFRKFDCSEIEEAAIQVCASEPQQAVLAYAKAWKACGICSRTLFNDESIARGIGPICAAKYGWSF